MLGDNENVFPLMYTTPALPSDLGDLLLNSSQSETLDCDDTNATYDGCESDID